MIIKVTLIYRHAPTSKHRDTLDIIAEHAYRDAKGKLVTPTHKRQVHLPYPQSITEGLDTGISVLAGMLSARRNPFQLAETGEPDERAFRLVG